MKHLALGLLGRDPVGCYRFVIKRIGDKVPWENDNSSALGSHKRIRIRELALYDADGNLQSHGLTQTTEGGRGLFVIVQ